MKKLLVLLLLCTISLSACGKAEQSNNTSDSGATEDIDEMRKLIREGKTDLGKIDYDNLVPDDNYIEPYYTFYLINKQEEKSVNISDDKQLSGVVSENIGLIKIPESWDESNLDKDFDGIIDEDGFAEVNKLKVKYKLYNEVYSDEIKEKFKSEQSIEPKIFEHNGNPVDIFITDTNISFIYPVDGVTALVDIDISDVEITEEDLENIFNLIMKSF